MSDAADQAAREWYEQEFGFGARELNAITGGEAAEQQRDLEWAFASGLRSARPAWTKAVPTSAGWYWWRDDESDPCVVEVYPDESDEGTHCLMAATPACSWPVSDENGAEWSGPIPHPTPEA